MYKMNASFDIMRTGKCYSLTNYGEQWKFEVMEIFDNNDFRIKMIDTLEEQLLSELIAYGKGKDFKFDEL
ncbi:hypothetical protein MNBD_BACTEROID06-928 [hydrothermal vent metagenome]|uniref:Uncharacterized protein n=1 Tax=hydrothermal vent metagenome TaxID=652676 RepID=A0A3B0UM68_9ZZZZ